ncbi:MAG TPA: hypothetical protein VGR89_03100 [Puia sp.]|nr:hypothetical protein [Puia sp.]
MYPLRLKATPPVNAYTPQTGFNYSNSRLHGLFQRAPQGSMQVNVPKGVPSFLGARPILFFGWMVAMIMVSLDEWHTYHILPRPARLWYTSLTFFILTGVSVVDSLVPIVNMFAIGMIIVLGMQYYNSPGKFETPQATEGPTNG